MAQIATTIGQSKHLLELGLDQKTADMLWMDTNSVKPHIELMDDGIFNHRNYLVRFPNTSLPAWSLSALLEVMQKELEVGLFKTPISGEYFFSWWTDDHHMGYDYKEPIDAAYEMVCWLLEQGLIKKGGEQ